LIPASDNADPASVKDSEGVIAALAWMMGGVLMFAGVMLTVRLLLIDVPTTQTTFLRYAIGALILVPFVGRFSFSFFKSNHRTLFVIRACLHGAAVFLWFFAVLHAALADVNAMLNLVPVYVVIGAAVMFGEILTMPRMITILVSFAGALLIVRPGFAEINIGMLAIFAAGPAFASSELIAKKLKADYDDNMIIITLSMLIALLLFIPAMLVWQPMTLSQWFGVCLIGLLATLAHVAIMRSFRGPMWASQSGKFIQLLFVAAFGFILFDEIPAMTTWAGAFLVLSSISYIAFVEARKHKS